MTEIEKDQLLSTLDAIAETDGAEAEATESVNDEKNGKRARSPSQPSYRDVVATAKPKAAKKVAPSTASSESPAGVGTTLDDKTGTKNTNTAAAQPLKAFSSRKIKSWADEEEGDDDDDLSMLIGAQSTTGGEEKVVAAVAETNAEHSK